MSLSWGGHVCIGVRASLSIVLLASVSEFARLWQNSLGSGSLSVVSSVAVFLVAVGLRIGFLGESMQVMYNCQCDGRCNYHSHDQGRMTQHPHTITHICTHTHDPRTSHPARCKSSPFDKYTQINPLVLGFLLVASLNLILHATFASRPILHYIAPVDDSHHQPESSSSSLPSLSSSSPRPT